MVSDEVYEHLVYDGVPHIPFATLPGMWERTLSIYSSGKTFSATGWKIGWVVGPAELVCVGVLCSVCEGSWTAGKVCFRP